MALIPVIKQLEAIQAAKMAVIAGLGSGQTSVSVDGISYSCSPAVLTNLTEQEQILYSRISKKSTRFRTRPDFRA